MAHRSSLHRAADLIQNRRVVDRRRHRPRLAGLLKKDKSASYKTGTLDGVRTLAGYANTSKNGRVRFAISLKGNDGELRFRLLKAMEPEL